MTFSIHSKAVEIPGPPIPLKRHREAISKGCFIRRYDPSKKDKQYTRAYFAAQYKGPILQGAVHMTIIFYMPIPKATSKKNRALMLSNEIEHNRKPDIDNLEKYTLDCLTGLLYRDDSQVTRKFSQKLFSENPRTVISWE